MSEGKTFSNYKLNRWRKIFAAFLLVPFPPIAIRFSHFPDNQERIFFNFHCKNKLKEKFFSGEKKKYRQQRREKRVSTTHELHMGSLCVSAAAAGYLFLYLLFWLLTSRKIFRKKEARQRRKIDKRKVMERKSVIKLHMVEMMMIEVWDGKLLN